MSKLLPPRDPEMLLREMSARIKIKDIKSLYKLRDRIAVKWYESGFVGVLFVAALSFLLIIIKLVPDPNPVIRNFVIGSSVALILVVTAVLEFLLRKFHALRRLYELQSRLIDDLEKQIVTLRRQMGDFPENTSSKNDDDTPQSSDNTDDSKS